MEFRYTPLVSGPGASRVSLHISFDGWKADVMDYVPTEDASEPVSGVYTTGYFVLFRMVPPGKPFGATVAAVAGLQVAAAGCG